MTVDRARRIRISKRLSYHLRHDPGSAGLELDHRGWADLDQLVARLDGIARSDVLEVAAGDQRRFEVSFDGTHIRARYGHSVAVDLGHASTEPPSTLFHGTAARHLAAILREGLAPRGRRQVHLSESVAEAEAVGRRHGRPVVLVVDAAAMHAGGAQFSRAGEGVWLVDHVPPRFLSTS